MWTDVFQAFSMMICLITLYVKGISEAGGVSEIYRVSQAGQRLEFFKYILTSFSADLLRI